ncbi:Aste57867_23629 [Aphanomyces stellatus]|uniref:Aste57867_23629 protein n=1 Tax=Aphanomyces stellatus TaxID=120398 RepID=A0A485LN60_9STRA|nr:hypothetical protein As57867_023557 [Aphanomyces stellatus]VFU00274.1 Aste57867_23629 [Aphanomyces stellatus]
MTPSKEPAAAVDGAATHSVRLNVHHPTNASLQSTNPLLDHIVRENLAFPQNNFFEQARDLFSARGAAQTNKVDLVCNQREDKFDDDGELDGEDAVDDEDAIDGEDAVDDQDKISTRRDPIYITVAH